MRLIQRLIHGLIESVLYVDCKTTGRCVVHASFIWPCFKGWRGPSVGDRVSAGAELTFLLSIVLLRSLVHVPHVPNENILAVGLVAAEIAEKLGRCTAYGAQVTLETRLPRVPLSAFRAYVRLAHVLPEIVGVLCGRTYKLDATMLERSFLKRRVSTFPR